MNFDCVVVGAGFASTFFLGKLLRRVPKTFRVLVLERGGMDTWKWQIENRRRSSLRPEETFRNATPWKRWVYAPGFGGGSKCWTGNAPRMMPNDFRMHTAYGVGVDWPLDYETLAPFYDEVESTMAVAGPDRTPYPRGGPHPLPPHRFSDPDKIFFAADPEFFFSMPCARPTRPTGNRPPCCGSSVCYRCPIDSKFTIENTMGDVYADERITLLTGAEVLNMDIVAGRRVKAIHYRRDGRDHQVRTDLIALGANAIFNPFLMMQSGLDHPLLGRYLVEQASKAVDVDLDGVDNFGGSTYVTGLSYRYYDGPHRANHSGFLIETNNGPKLRIERGRYREYLELRVVMEDLPQIVNRVEVDGSGRHPVTRFEKYSDYVHKAVERLPEYVEAFLGPLPVERYHIRETFHPTDAHIQGTTVMGNDPETSVVDRHLVHHAVRNLVVLGSSVFPNCAPAHPTLTLSALSLWAAENLN